MARVRLTEAARDDLRDIRVYSKAAHGTTATRAYLLGLRATFTMLGDHPLAGAEAVELAAELRSFAYRSHRIYYRPDVQGIVILRILHLARDRQSALDPER